MTHIRYSDTKMLKPEWHTQCLINSNNSFAISRLAGGAACRLHTLNVTQIFIM